MHGVGEKRGKMLEKLGIYTVGDFLKTAPVRYEDRCKIMPIAALCEGDTACVRAIAIGKMAVRKANSGKVLCIQRFRDESGTMDGVWFHAPFLRQAFVHGKVYVLYGKVTVQGGRRQMHAPVFDTDGMQKNTGKIVPVYPLSAGLSETIMQNLAGECLPIAESATDILPEKIRSTYGLLDMKTCFRYLHAPRTMFDVEKAQKRLKFEELFLLLLGIQLSREKVRTKRGLPLCADKEAFFKGLPFAPTDAQRRVVAEVFRDLERDVPMNRLVEGDVGSGKTVIAAAVLYAAAVCGMQGVLMAPTEILARQHAKTLETLLPGMPVCLLTGQLSAAEKRTALARIADGSAKIIVGTHALLSEKVQFCRVGAVCVDEQHRFGVRQRGFLEKAGEAPHVLVMSATPIPRTLSLTLYGDLDISVLDARPEGRQKVDTFAVPPAYRARVHAFIKKETEKGNRAYIVCPRVEEDEEMASVLAYTESLMAQFAPGKVLCLHGKMKDKDAVMEQFIKGEAQVLVATTVIEVGVDVPEATVMLVENAERFGLAQLHQLRGRVGRGKEKAYCILISEAQTKEAQARLRTMRQTADGFRIAEADLALRGPGEFFGTRQHGLPALRFADPALDGEILKEAHQAAIAVFEENSTLSRYPKLLEAVSAFYAIARN